MTVVSEENAFSCFAGGIVLCVLADHPAGVQAESDLPVGHSSQVSAALAMGSLPQWDPQTVQTAGLWV